MTSKGAAASRKCLLALAALLVLGAVAGILALTSDISGEIKHYDQAVHAFNTFSVSLAFYWLFAARLKQSAQGRKSFALPLVISVFTFGVTAGAWWEILEWHFIDWSPAADTINDLLMDSIGAAAAAILGLIHRNT